MFRSNWDGTIVIPLYHFHLFTNIQIFLCSLYIWDVYLVPLIVAHVITHLLLDGSYPPLRISIWLIGFCLLIFTLDIKIPQTKKTHFFIFELTPTTTLILQTKWLIKPADHPKNLRQWCCNPFNLSTLFGIILIFWYYFDFFEKIYSLVFKGILGYFCKLISNESPLKIIKFVFYLNSIPSTI